ncbi:capsule biosynthesis protein [Acidocella facilis]|uniref:capsule biosynthesis protein n=1 Tax=Acidocella facilis TaxID=525 RepID=UPI001F34310C|nr:capsular biosynthesis protein [Acidocella facilis]
MNSAAGRHFLFLQGMPCGFFPQIAARLRAAGARTTRINLCLGDAFFWQGPAAVNYRGRFKAWPGYIERFFRREQVTDLILLGEQRYYHREAVAVAQRLGIAVTVTDFGYIRPDWITLEHDGMSGGSHFPRDPAAVRALAARLPEPDWAPRFVDSAVTMARGDLLHNFANLFGCWLYPFYRRSDRRPATPIYFPACGLRLWSNARRQPAARRLVDDLSASGQAYYVFPLQLNFDFQIVAYSPFPDMEAAIEQVLESFAAYAPAAARLVVKEHPWDPAIIDWERVVRRKTREKGLAGRVHYLRGGDLNRLIEASQGVVTVNSTVGMRALQLGRPLLPLGQAVYDIPGLTWQGGLDRFWTEAPPPDTALTADFLKALAGTVLIRGVYFEPEGLAHAVAEASARLLAGQVGAPLPAAG